MLFLSYSSDNNNKRKSKKKLNKDGTRQLPIFLFFSQREILSNEMSSWLFKGTTVEGCWGWEGSQTAPAVRSIRCSFVEMGGSRMGAHLAVLLSCDFPPFLLPLSYLWTSSSSLPQLSAEGLAGSRWSCRPTGRGGAWLAKSAWRGPPTTHSHT